MYRWQISLIGALLTAALLAAALPPLKLAFLAPLALTPLLYGVAGPMSWRTRFLAGWLAGFVYWLAVCHWIGDTLDAYGGLNGPLALLTLILFALAKGLHLAVFASLAGPLMSRKWAIPAVAALWTGIERTHGPLGFAWLALGNAGIEMGLPLRVAPYVGVYGLSYIFAALACGVTLVALRRDRRQLAWLLPLAGLWALPAIQLTEAPSQQAVTVQPSIHGAVGWTVAEKDRMLRQLSLMTLAEALEPSRNKPSLVLWPEAPAPLYYYDDADFRTAATEIARLSGTPTQPGASRSTRPFCSMRRVAWSAATTRCSSSPSASSSRRDSAGSQKSRPRRGTSSRATVQACSRSAKILSACSSAMNPPSPIWCARSRPAGRTS